jgi:leucyl-tRNA synthetase
MVCKETHKCAKCGFLFPEQVKGESQNKKCAICGGEVETGRIEKMSKSKKNVIEPSELISEYGADTTRLFCLFAAPPERDLEWSKTGVEGGFRFINRVFRIVNKNLKRIASAASYADASDKLAGETKKLYKKTHVTIARVTNDIENRFHFNTAISAVMELVNALYLIDDNASAKKDPNFAGVLKFAIETAILLLAPIVPHVCEELWQILGHKNGVTYAKWPKYLKEALAKDEVQIVAQVNGKIRSKFLSATDIEDEKLKEIALADERVLNFINNKPIKKVIVVKNKLVNIVV